VPEKQDTIATPIALEARDLIPETWNALAIAPAFGPAALERRHNRVIRKVFGELLDQDDQEVLDAADSRIIEYVGKQLAYELIDPGIEYWSRQATAYSVSERESKSYVDRAADLRKLKAEWLPQIAELQRLINALIPQRSPARDYPRVANIGDGVPHLTADPFALPPAYGPVDGT
jgi:hypothetical protein